MPRLVEEGTPSHEVLPVQEYAQEHLAGGINIPLKKLTRFDRVHRYQPGTRDWLAAGLPRKGERATARLLQTRLTRTHKSALCGRAWARPPPRSPKEACGSPTVGFAVATLESRFSCAPLVIG